MNTLRYYLPIIVDDTWNKYQLGTVIFTIQGFERRKKESKNIFRSNTNKQGNQVLQCMKRLWDVFYYYKQIRKKN